MTASRTLADVSGASGVGCISSKSPSERPWNSGQTSSVGSSCSTPLTSASASASAPAPASAPASESRNGSTRHCLASLSMNQFCSLVGEPSRDHARLPAVARVVAVDRIRHLHPISHREMLGRWREMLGRWREMLGRWREMLGRWREMLGRWRGRRGRRGRSGALLLPDCKCDGCDALLLHLHAGFVRVGIDGIACSGTSVRAAAARSQQLRPAGSEARVVVAQLC
eukprot:scaffold3651_cov61-Phaeocystis_antarctica.AAC.13